MGPPAATSATPSRGGAPSPWLAAGYPLLAHLGTLRHDPRLQWLALAWLLALVLWPRLWTGSAGRLARSWVALLIGSAGLYWLVNAGHGLYALYLPPIVIPAGLLLLFGRSLRVGEVPLVTRMAAAIRGAPLPEDLLQYSRRVTQAWCAVFVGLLVSAIGCALLATPAVWSLMTNIVHYVIIGSMFVLEFTYRRIRYRHHEHTGLVQYLRRLAQTSIR